ncbi:MAG TPA: hypothetical protein VNK23_01230 [Candidatus Dormibacteraeota bacterium]|nr:hypothetical protein [Candidatus Dormibacteraeota bacterium]
MRTAGQNILRIKWLARLLAAIIPLALAAAATARQPATRQSARPMSRPIADVTPPTPTSYPAATATPPVTETNQQFLGAADQVLAQMSLIVDLPVKRPLKKSLRSRAQIRAYLLKEQKHGESKSQDYADEKSLEAFGLIPKGFALDSFMIDLLTEQVAGMYDPKAKEFYIADWIPIGDQRGVMAHEMTHALEDQSFHVERWMNAARSNDDAEMARDSVSEGSAMVAMIDYSLRDTHVSVRDLPDLAELVGSGAFMSMGQDPLLSKAPPYIRDSLVFPYLEGTTFTQEFLKAHTGWVDLHLLFENPPVSTQQIMHPALYLKGVKPADVGLPKWKRVVPKNWKLLEQNVMGEFGLQELLKQFIGEKRAEAISPAWSGDRYAVFEVKQTGETPIVYRLKLDNSLDAAKLFGEFSDALEKKYAARTQTESQPNFLEFQTASGGVFLRCIADECLDVESTSRATFDKIDRAIGWTPAPAAASSASSASISVPAPGRREETARASTAQPFVVQ